MPKALEKYRQEGVVSYRNTGRGHMVEIMMEDFVESILHGSDDHKEWLVEAGECYLRQMSPPEPRG